MKDPIIRRGRGLRCLFAACLASGVSPLFLRTAPLGVVLLDTAWPWATVHAGVLLALAWRFGHADRPLWTYPAAH